MNKNQQEFIRLIFHSALGDPSKLFSHNYIFNLQAGSFVEEEKGIFITTSDFSKDAKDFVSKIDSKIILINGEQLAEYMIKFNVGVTTTSKYELKRIDSDYFILE